METAGSKSRQGGLAAGLLDAELHSFPFELLVGDLFERLRRQFASRQ